LPTQEVLWAQVTHRNKNQALAKKQAQTKLAPLSPQNLATLRTEVTVQRKPTEKGPSHQSQDRCDPVDITCQVYMALNAAKSSLILLSGC
jgi:hypothetical protein